jgi:hypothetical protein
LSGLERKRKSVDKSSERTYEKFLMLDEAFEQEEAKANERCAYEIDESLLKLARAGSLIRNH